MALNNKSRKIDYTTWSQTELIREIKKLEKKKKYGLIWDEERTKEVFEEEAQKKLPILKDVTKNGIEDTSKPNNILIEGDNYHTLSVLNYTSRNSIDVIFIDPPYNTGHEDFRYNDHYVEKDDAYRHSKWLSFMNKRLRLAKNLLKSTGLLFITIDDHELSQLKLLCDDIFLEKHFIMCIPWNARKSISNDAIISQNHHYILFYAKNESLLQSRKNTFRLSANEKDFSNPDNDPRGKWTADPFDAPEVRKKNLMYKIENPNTGEIFLPPKGRHWTVPENEYIRLLKDDRIIFGKSGKAKPQKKRFWNDAMIKGKTPNSWWDDIGTTTNGTQELENILGEKKFNNPKPVSLIKKIVTLATNKNGVVLDFFAGSGTTGQAILELNKEDEGNRKFILCTNNENKICTDVCYPRLKKVIKGYKNSKNEEIPGLGGNLKYFKTSFVNSEPTDQNKKTMVEQSTEMLCLKEDCFELVKEGKQFRIFKNYSDHYLGIIYYYEGIELFKKEAEKINKKINTYVFSLSDEIDEDEFKDIRSLVTLKPIPFAILNIYRRIFAYVQTKRLSRKAHK